MAYANACPTQPTSPFNDINMGVNNLRDSADRLARLVDQLCGARPRPERATANNVAEAGRGLIENLAIELTTLNGRLSEDIAALERMMPYS